MRIGWEAPPHTSAPRLRLPQSLLPAQVTLGFAPRPRLTPPPRARPGYQHIPPAPAGDVRARPDRRPRGKRRGRGDAWNPSPGPAAATGGRRREKRRETGRPRGGRRTEGPGAGGAEDDERGRRRRGRTQARGCAAGPSRSRPRPIPTPTLGPRSQDPNCRPGRRAWAGPSPVRPGLPAPPPTGQRETHQGRAGGRRPGPGEAAGLQAVRGRSSSLFVFHGYEAGKSRPRAAWPPPEPRPPRVRAATLGNGARCHPARELLISNPPSRLAGRSQTHPSPRAGLRATSSWLRSKHS
ncbi:hypothetical protein NN561_013204 [Cricetulus griseus]